MYFKIFIITCITYNMNRNCSYVTLKKLGLVLSSLIILGWCQNYPFRSPKRSRWQDSKFCKHGGTLPLFLSVFKLSLGIVLYDALGSIQYTKLGDISKTYWFKEIYIILDIPLLSFPSVWEVPSLLGCTLLALPSHCIEIFCISIRFEKYVTTGVN